MNAVPNRVWFSLTGLCNNACVWCHRKGSEVKRFLGPEVIVPIAKTLSASGVKFCTLAGGEPTLHPDCLALAGTLSQIFNSCALVTNGRLLSGPLPEEWLTGRVRVTISLHGATPQHYLENTGSKRGFTEAIQAVLNLGQKGLHPSLSVVLGPENIAHATEFVRLAVDLAVDTICFTIAIPSIDDATYTSVPMEIPKAVEEIHALCMAAGQKHVFIFSLPWCMLRREFLEELIDTRSIMFNCPVPDGKVLVIKENGALGLCTHTTSLELLDAEATQEIMSTPDRFLAFWNSEKMHGLRQVVDVDRHPNCAVCTYRNYCKGGCPLWWKFFNFGDIIAERGGDYDEGFRDPV